ncbi:hypothetical protein CLU85_0478 [Acidovorax sp. 69]|uniref:hypothetical protein n=1 Tax=Acidovorax sp. 69 TaxID=2035202 RepID=UPI000CAA98DB|nr:hypothetical protein [Acidovorax sp. 69]PJI95752.1 hypothetical protein CLU85_0478 [Acidovorax sp. 69]
MSPQHMHPDDYQRLRESAKRHALHLRQEALREAPGWVVRGFMRVARRVLRGAPLGVPLSTPSTPELTTPCQPSF